MSVCFARNRLIVRSIYSSGVFMILDTRYSSLKALAHCRDFHSNFSKIITAKIVAHI